MKAVMYHYVRRFDPRYPFFRFLNFEHFKKQLDYFSASFGIATRDEWEAFIDEPGHGAGGSQKAGKVVLTFDDAMRCHSDYVVGELERRGLWGIFYIPTMPYSGGGVLDVHRIHLLTGAIDGKVLYRELMQIIREEMIPDSKREDFRQLTYARQSNYEGVAEFKRLLNYFIDYEYRSEVISDIAARVGYRFPGRGFYIREESLRDMAAAGHVIGSHTMHHPVMSKLSFAQQQWEIKASFAVLEDIMPLSEYTYCHPYGGFHSFNEDTVRILDEHGVRYSFNVESTDITETDVRTMRHALPRYDCNEFLFGAAS